MRKSDIEFHSEMGRTSHPAINVKVRNLPYSEDGWKKVLDEVTRQEGTDMPLSFLMSALEDDDAGEIFGLACEDEWEYLTEWIKSEIFDGYNLEIYSEGRSGGWMVFHNLPDVEDWDAVMVAKYAKCVRVARDIVEGIPYHMVSLIAMNAWEWEKATRHNACVKAAKRVLGLRLPNYDGKVA